jgi:hypothetical protein
MAQRRDGVHERSNCARHLYKACYLAPHANTDPHRQRNLTGALTTGEVSAKWHLPTLCCWDTCNGDNCSASDEGNPSTDCLILGYI